MSHRADPTYQTAYRAAELAYQLGEQVRSARQSLGWTQSELALKSGMKQNAISRLEAGGVVPSVVTLDRVATALQLRLTIEFAAPDAR
ncbi:multiprotein-bridging factor 1 family protein [Nocardia sp. NPDC059239]|uniref:helix-turn-helix domain-containing protein n=1 Tax=unclassified Nocardia TaxID=2637762 RepID=UPI003692CF16